MKSEVWDKTRLEIEVSRIETYILGDCELGELPSDFIYLINNDGYSNRSKLIRAVLKICLGESICK